MSILIKNISHNNQICDIFIENSRFARIAPQLEQTADTVIDGSGHAILPAFYPHPRSHVHFTRFGDNKTAV
ncbi:MAG: hypothetical protein ACLSE6_03590 [Alphaproteobacteria bacterium]